MMWSIFLWPMCPDILSISRRLGDSTPTMTAGSICRTAGFPGYGWRVNRKGDASEHERRTVDRRADEQATAPSQRASDADADDQGPAGQIPGADLGETAPLLS